MAESFTRGDLVEVISADPGSCVRVGDRGTVIAGMPNMARIAVDYGHDDIVLSLATCIRKIRPPQDWVKLCNLDEVKHQEPVHV